MLLPTHWRVLDSIFRGYPLRHRAAPLLNQTSNPTTNSRTMRCLHQRCTGHHITTAEDLRPGRTHPRGHIPTIRNRIQGHHHTLSYPTRPKLSRITTHRTIPQHNTNTRHPIQGNRRRISTINITNNLASSRIHHINHQTHPSAFNRPPHHPRDTT